MADTKKTTKTTKSETPAPKTKAASAAKPEKPAPKSTKTAAKSPKATKTATKPAAKPKAAKSEKPATKSATKTAAKPKTKTATTKVQPTVVLHVASEGFPFSGTGGLGEVIGSLPAAVNAANAGIEARVVLPLYTDCMPSDHREKLTFLCHFQVPVAWRSQYCGLFEYKHKGVTFYFIDNEYYFRRGGLYGFRDDGERFAFFSRAVLEAVPHMDVKPNILHCHDWQTALTPVFYKLFYMQRPELSDIKTLFTIHNIEYQGKFGKESLEELFGIPNKEFPSLEYGGCVNLMKAAIEYADRISTVSETYAKEILTEDYAHGLHFILRQHVHKLGGILNGIDTAYYDPAVNPSLFHNYTADRLDGKKQNKLELQQLLSMPQDGDAPVIAVISRLVGHKGMDLIRGAMNELLKRNMQLVILGTGDTEYENYFRYIESVAGNKVRASITFNKDLAQKMYAGADLFLMPSKAEPCGLSQMIACRYGTVPIVRATGGLKDSIDDCGDGTTGNGFVFSGYGVGELLHAIDRAIGLYRDYPELFGGVVRRAMHTDFTWNKSANTYIEYYKAAVQG